MDELKHLFPSDTASTESYTKPAGGGGEFLLPPRDDRTSHGRKLISDIESAQESASNANQQLAPSEEPKGTCLDFESDPEFKLQLQSLEMLRSGIELRNSRVTKDKVMHATVFVPEGKMGLFIKRFEAYSTDVSKTSGKPKNQKLAESISAVRHAAIESFWTDAGTFPGQDDGPVWWEVWLREATNPADVGQQFRDRAAVVGVDVGQREIRFPERRVLLARATRDQLASIENLFDLLAELRFAATLSTEFVELSPQDQADFIDEALQRIQSPTENAPAVCHLDTGVNRSHPLIALALAEEHVLAVEPEWSTADKHGHGTEMAGLALYGDLVDLLESDTTVALQNCLESVKILPDVGENDPDLYGEITSQAVSRAEIAAPDRSNRVFCLTVTADGRDEGRPLSWSGAIDQICAGVDTDGANRRLLLAAVGNTPRDGREEYPHHNHVQGIEDPAHSWNALAVGAYTEKDVIRSDEYNGWEPVAPHGHLSPSSRTSLVWPDRVWPLKPDIVMEGGNNALMPSTQEADAIDDLMLLTTRVGPGGAPLLTTTGDTSAATAQAARYAAHIWAAYPELWPETVRAMMVHSARWTDQMLAEFPGNKKAAVESRLRCYGYGVPDLSAALWSLANSATLVIEDELHPFEMVDTEIKTKDMHLHALPWPTQVLEGLGEEQVRMRVSLSYFIEPSPGRRGWTKKHMYQSHGLRFDVKRPAESEEEFLRRINAEARDEEEGTGGYGSDSRSWELGDRLRRKGSIHSDVWVGTGAELAAAGQVAVYPISGWWRYRKHLNRWDQAARYALIISIETDAVEVDLYTPIAAQIDIPTEVTIETD